MLCSEVGKALESPCRVAQIICGLCTITDRHALARAVIGADSSSRYPSDLVDAVLDGVRVFESVALAHQPWNSPQK